MYLPKTNSLSWDQPRLIGQMEDYRKAGCKEFMLTFAPKGGLWSSTNLFEEIRLFSNKVMGNLQCGLVTPLEDVESGLGLGVFLVEGSLRPYERRVRVRLLDVILT